MKSLRNRKKNSLLAPSGGKIQWAVQAESAKNHGKGHYQFCPI